MFKVSGSPNRIISFHGIKWCHLPTDKGFFQLSKYHSRSEITDKETFGYKEEISYLTNEIFAQWKNKEFQANINYLCESEKLVDDNSELRRYWENLGVKSN